MTAATATPTVKRISGVELFYVGGRGSYFMVQPEHGFVAIVSAEDRKLNGCHYWSAHGTRSIYEFLLGLNRDYALGKLFGETEEYDHEGSQAAFREHVLRERREAHLAGSDRRGGMTAQRARELWTDIEQAERDDELVNLIPDGWELLKRREKGCFEYFWTVLWIPFVDHIRAEREAGRLP